MRPRNGDPRSDGEPLPAGRASLDRQDRCARSFWSRCPARKPPPHKPGARTAEIPRPGQTQAQTAFTGHSGPPQSRGKGPSLQHRSFSQRASPPPARPLGRVRGHGLLQPAALVEADASLDAGDVCELRGSALGVGGRQDRAIGGNPRRVRRTQWCTARQDASGSRPARADAPAHLLTDPLARNLRPARSRQPG